MPVLHTARRRFGAALIAGAALTAVALGSHATATATPAPSTSSTASYAAPAGYYDAAEGKSGQQLRQALHDIVDDHDTLSYSEVWGALRETDEDPYDASSVILLYSGYSKSEYDNGGDVDDWNREHVWAKSHGDFGTSRGPGTDLHHLRPTDVTVNGARGNKDFDHGGSPVHQAPESYTDHDSFEPRDAVKGDVARMIFYMAVRYEGDDSFADLELNDLVGNGSAPYMGRLSVLKQWHEQDPPDTFEQRRNDVIYERYQHNRNPFVDRPEWVGSIWP
ncbi:endonuclease I family protein [Streptomyces sp. WMMC897]|uniref:endonuclease I family protein n=1 Tax=Streptomyces sp. WMMC897 TaxID=3014782 RepID=UPI0022B5E978|nr:endonuclease [Streptomyces sp. WMMC897]MCZ7412970.1 endonuclease [Streptomyces sp. WMMC897]